MEGIKVNIKSIVKNISKNVGFLQPVYEAIMNSLEAGADKICIRFSSAPSVIPGLLGSIDGFTITDNGIGFTKENRDSFVLYGVSLKHFWGARVVVDSLGLPYFRMSTLQAK